jgi:FAD/FMN-containing dehydrogenase
MSERDNCVRALERELGDRVRLDAEHLENYAWDYGRLVHRPPAVVVAARELEELLAALRIGADFGMPICTASASLTVRSCSI